MRRAIPEIALVLGLTFMVSSPLHAQTLSQADTLEELGKIASSAGFGALAESPDRDGSAWFKLNLQAGMLIEIDKEPALPEYTGKLIKRGDTYYYFGVAGAPDSNPFMLAMSGPDLNTEQAQEIAAKFNSGTPVPILEIDPKLPIFLMSR
jgi:hypothetical protein